jgi:hypothetical protein
MDSDATPLNSFSIVTLIFFVIVLPDHLRKGLIGKSIIFVIKAGTIHLPPIHLSNAPPRALQLSIPLNLATAPVLVVLLLKAAQCIPWSVIADGITGGGSGVQPYNIMILFFSLAYLAMSLGTSELEAVF